MWSWYLIMGDTQGSHDDSHKTKLKGVWLFHQLGLCLETVYLFVDVLISPRNYQKTMRKSWLSSSNTDQTLLTFDMPFTSTVDIRGTKTVQLNTTKQEKNLFTLMLACTADGGKLPPYIIFKRKTLPKVTWPTGIIIHCQDKGWMDESLTKDWIKTVWAKWPGSLTHKSLVVPDSFRCHKSEAVKEILCDIHRKRLAIIPGGDSDSSTSGRVSEQTYEINAPGMLEQLVWWRSTHIHSYRQNVEAIAAGYLSVDRGCLVRTQPTDYCPCI